MSFARRTVGSVFIEMKEGLSSDRPVGELDDLSQVPFSKFTETTRRIDTDRLDPHVQVVFNYFFPQFLSNPQATPWGGDKLELMVSPKQGTHFIGGTTRARRYAGDELLPPGRYHALRDTIARSGEPSSLVGEIIAYADPAHSLRPMMDDLSDKMLLMYPRELPDHIDDRLHMVVGPHVAGDFPPELELDPDGRNEFFLPVKRVKHNLDKVIDLRRPKTLEWMREKFVGLEKEHAGREGSTFMWPELKEGFVDFLYPLLAQPLGGGNPFIQGIGAWMRSHGVEAMVYPSARTDVDSEFEGDAIVRHRGFLMIDYRDSEPLEWTQFFGYQSAWYPHELRELNVASNLEGNPSWYSVHGVSELQDRRFVHDRKIAQNPSHPLNASHFNALGGSLTGGNVQGGNVQGGEENRVPDHAAEPAEPAVANERAAPGEPTEPAEPRSSALGAITKKVLDFFSPRRAQPARLIEGTITSNDYPSRALRQGDEGKVTVAITVAPDGMPCEVSIIASSGSSALDQATCKVIRRRFRFEPALDNKGKRVESVFNQSINWQLS